ncbi:MAG TPA: sulfur carrier protein ThiS [Pyrinomonadaceae bacterium]|nr:sulfur carrier protein ThiS [Pyrinomonadaceae bacterium]HQY66389.1 sulfur carrier protein ThiS [Pyrinomonadaceae bacterium]HRA41488.1 sulfur carrier protein ThiS [Pyrinomonadaceae bacterium]
MANITVYLNGETRHVTAETALAELLDQLSLPHQRIAIELNKTVIRRADWPNTTVNEGDRIEVVHFVGGG